MEKVDLLQKIGSLGRQSKHIMLGLQRFMQIKKRGRNARRPFYDADAKSLGILYIRRATLFCPVETFHQK